jgi:hypothetical protein
MSNADLLDRAVDEILAGRSPDASVLRAEEVGLAVRAARMASAVRAVPISTGRADIRRRVLTTALETKPRRRWSRWFVLVPSTVLLLGGGIAVASGKAVPGDPLYAVRRGLSAMRLAVALGDHAKAVALLDRAAGTLGDAELLASVGRDNKASKALRVFADDLADARAEIGRIDSADRGDLEARANALEARALLVANSIERGDPIHRPGGTGDQPSGEGNEGPSGSGSQSEYPGKSGDHRQDSGPDSSPGNGRGLNQDEGSGPPGQSPNQGSGSRQAGDGKHGSED